MPALPSISERNPMQASPRPSKDAVVTGEIAEEALAILNSKHSYRDALKRLHEREPYIIGASRAFEREAIERMAQHCGGSLDHRYYQAVVAEFSMLTTVLATAFMHGYGDVLDRGLEGIGAGIEDGEAPL